MPNYEKNKTLFASYKKTNSSEFQFVPRDLEKIQSHPGVKDSFNHAMDFFFSRVLEGDEKIEQYQVIAAP